MQRLLVCDLHATATMIEVGPDTDWKAAPPVEIICPQCIAARHEDAPTGTETVRSIVRRDPDFTGFSLAARRAYEERLERESAAGKITSGSTEEQEALAVMDDARPKAIWRDHNGNRKRRREYSPPPYRESQFVEGAYR